MATYVIWQDNGVSEYFDSEAESLNDVLDEFCQEAGYVDHADACQVLGQVESQFNIKEILENDDPGICPACSGSGEGEFDGTTCPVCKGMGE